MKKQIIIIVILGLLFYLFATLSEPSQWYRQVNMIGLIVATILFCFLFLTPLLIVINSRNFKLRIAMTIILLLLIGFYIHSEIVYFRHNYGNIKNREFNLMYNSMYEKELNNQFTSFYLSNPSFATNCIASNDEIDKVKREDCNGESILNCHTYLVYSGFLPDLPTIKKFTFYDQKCMKNLWLEKSSFGREIVISKAIIIEPYRKLASIILYPFFYTK